MSAIQSAVSQMFASAELIAIVGAVLIGLPSVIFLIHRKDWPWRWFHEEPVDLDSEWRSVQREADEDKQRRILNAINRRAS